jgi:hypothetical protein
VSAQWQYQRRLLFGRPRGNCSLLFSFHLNPSSRAGKRRSKQCTRHEGIWESRGTNPLTINFCTRWRWVVSFTSWPFYPRGNCPWHPVNRGLGGSRSGLDALVKVRVSCPCLETKEYFSDVQPVAVIILTDSAGYGVAMKNVYRTYGYDITSFYKFLTIYSLNLAD